MKMHLTLFEDTINTATSLDKLYTEENLNTNITIYNMNCLNWMKIFNSQIQLSNAFIIYYSQFIDWNWLVRPLDESMINLFHKKIKQWLIQLYAKPRTVDFIYTYNSKFDWGIISMNPPNWFESIHFEIFDKNLNWKLLTKHVSKLDRSLFVCHINEYDWDWISANYLPDSQFCSNFYSYINWDHPNLASNGVRYTLECIEESTTSDILDDCNSSNSFSLSF